MKLKDAIYLACEKFGYDMALTKETPRDKQKKVVGVRPRRSKMQSAAPG